MSQPIEYYDRYRREIRHEQIYGEASLRWTYETKLGRAALHTLVKRAAFSRWYGRRMDRPESRERIEPFVVRYGLDRDEFLLPIDQFRTFNEFFYRRLKPDARPIAPDPDVAVFPADGRHLCIPKLDATAGSGCGPGLFVKGQAFDLADLLGDAELAGRYHGGTLVLSRLCPVDYHRFHFPVAGVVQTSRSIDGPLFSVNPIALKQNIRILSTNKRAQAVVDSPVFGPVITMEVGATCVGGIVHTFDSHSAVEKGQEKGYFRFGGSSTVTIFPPNRIRLDADLVEQSEQCRELYARVGDRLGVALDRVSAS